MSKRKRVNPKRRPINAAQLKRKQDRAGQAFLLMSLYAMLDAGFDAKQIRRFVEKFDLVAELFLRNKLSIREMEETIQTDYEDALKELDAEEVKRFFMEVEE